MFRRRWDNKEGVRPTVPRDIVNDGRSPDRIFVLSNRSQDPKRFEYLERSYGGVGSLQLNPLCIVSCHSFQVVKNKDNEEERTKRRRGKSRVITSGPLFRPPFWPRLIGTWEGLTRTLRSDNSYKKKEFDNRDVKVLPVKLWAFGV